MTSRELAELESAARGLRKAILGLTAAGACGLLDVSCDAELLEAIYADAQRALSATVTLIGRHGRRRIPVDDDLPF